MNRAKLVIRTLLAAGLLFLGFGAKALPLEGEYVRLTPSCFPSAKEWRCEDPIEEGIALQRRTGSLYYLYVKTRGVNGHFCEFNSIARLSQGKLLARENECVVRISFPTPHEANLTSEGDSCQSYCAARATLNANHLVYKALRKSRVLPVPLHP